jgi:hypothetical protein
LSKTRGIQTTRSTVITSIRPQISRLNERERSLLRRRHFGFQFGQLLAQSQDPLDLDPAEQILLPDGPQEIGMVSLQVPL